MEGQRHAQGVMKIFAPSGKNRAFPHVNQDPRKESDRDRRGGIKKTN